MSKLSRITTMKIINFFNYTHHFFSLILISVLYFIISIYNSPYQDRNAPLVLYFHFTIYLRYFVPFIFVFWSTKSIIYLSTHRNEGFEGLGDCWRGLYQDYITRENIIRLIFLFICLPLFKFSYNNMKQGIPVLNHETNDLFFHNIDYIIHGKAIPWDILQRIIGHPLITKFIDFCYLFWGTLYLFTIYWMTVSRRSFLRVQYFYSLAASWIIIGNIAATYLASVGPCFFNKIITNGTNPYNHMMMYLRGIPNLKAVQIQDVLWHTRSNAIFIPWGGISAMPSMHVSIAILTALAFSNINRWFAFAMYIFAFIIQIGSVHLGCHYAIDGYISILATLAIWLTTKKLLLLLGLKEDPFSTNHI